MTWRGEHDKIGLTHTTPLTEAAAIALGATQRELGVIGIWVFPAARGDRTQAMSGDAARHLFQRLASKAGLPAGQRYGWHSFRRKFGNELRHIPLKDLCDLGGWKKAATILTCYQQPSEQAQREGLEQRREVRIGAVSGTK